MQTPMVSEGYAGKEMGKRRPIVRREEGAGVVDAAPSEAAQTQDARRAELDAAIEALEGAHPEKASKRKKAPSKTKTPRRRGVTTANDETLLSSSASEDEPSTAPAPPSKTTRTTRGRGRGTARSSSTARGGATGRVLQHVPTCTRRGTCRWTTSTRSRRAAARASIRRRCARGACAGRVV